MNYNPSRAGPSSVSGARKGPKDEQPVLPSINTAFLPPTGLVGLPEVPSPNSGAGYYKAPNPDRVPAKSFNFNHEPETLAHKFSNEEMNNINDDPKPFVPPISPDILQTSTKDDQERLIKWEITGDVNLTGCETYRTDGDKQPTPFDIPNVNKTQPLSAKLRKSVSFDIPIEPSAPPLSPEAPSEVVTRKPPVSPRRTQSLAEKSLMEPTGNSGPSLGPPPSGDPQIGDDVNMGRMFSVGTPSDDRHSANVEAETKLSDEAVQEMDLGRMKRFHVSPEYTEERVPSPPAAPKPPKQDDFNFGRMRFRQINVGAVATNNNSKEQLPSTLESAPKRLDDNNTGIEEQNGGKVRKQWQRDSTDLVIVTQNDQVLPASEGTTIQASSHQDQSVITTDSTVQSANQITHLKARLKEMIEVQDILTEQMDNNVLMRGMDDLSQNPVSVTETTDCDDSESTKDQNPESKEQYFQDLHDIFNSCDKIEETLCSLPTEQGESEEAEDLITIKETALKIVDNVIERAIKEEEKRKLDVNAPEPVFDLLNCDIAEVPRSVLRYEEPLNSCMAESGVLPEVEFLDRQGTPTTVPDTDEDAAAKAEILNLEISNGVDRFISATGGLDQGATRSNSQASSQAAEVPPEALSEASHDDLEERMKLIRQNSFVDESTTQEPGAQELEEKLKNIRNSFERKLSSSKEEVEAAAAAQGTDDSSTGYSGLYPLEKLEKCKQSADVEEKRSQMLARSDSGVLEGSKALQHIQETLRLQMMRTTIQGTDDMSFIEQMNQTAEINTEEGRQSAASNAASDTSSVKSGPISQPVTVDLKYDASDWSCRRCFNVNFAARPTCQQCGLPRQARSQGEREMISDETEKLKEALQSYTEKEKFWSEEIERQRSRVKELNETVEDIMKQRVSESHSEEEINALRTEVEQLKEKCVVQETKKEELCGIFEERLKELQGSLESQTLKNTELCELNSELAEKFEVSEGNFRRLESDREQLVVEMKNLEETIETLNKGHSIELDSLRQKSEDNHSDYCDLEKAYSLLKEEHLHVSGELKERIKQEVSNDNSSKEELERLKIELQELKATSEDFEITTLSLTEEKQEVEAREAALREKLQRKNSEIANLKEAVKKYVAEFDQLQHELSVEKHIRSETEQKIVVLETLKNEMEEENKLQTNRSEDTELLRRLLDEESAKCLRLGEELKYADEKMKESDILRENFETEKLKSERLEITIAALTDNEETIALRKALGEAQGKIQNLEQTVELLKENNKVIDELRRELEEERSSTKSARSQIGSPRGKDDELDDLRRDLLIEKAKRTEIEQSYHSLQGSVDVEGLKEALETERARSSRLEKQFGKQLDELRLEGASAAARGAAQDVTTLFAAERLKVIELEKTMESLKTDLSQARKKLRHQRFVSNSSSEAFEKCNGFETHQEEMENNHKTMLHRIRVLEESKAELMEKVRAENNIIYKKYDTTIEDYRQQLRQIKENHTTAITRLESEISEYQKRIEQDAAAICTLEERLNNVVKRNREYDSEIATITQQNTEMRSRLQSDIPALTAHAMTPIPRPESGRQCNRTRADKDVPQNFVAMEQLIVRLRREIANMKNQVTRAKTTSAEQQKELNAATLKITHLTGELNEVQRKRTDQRRERRREHESEIKNIQDEMLKAHSTIEHQMREVRELRTNVTKYKQAATKLKASGKEKDAQIHELQKQISKLTESSVSETKNQSLPDVTSLDDKSFCAGHRHKDIIENQKEALLELRAKIKVLEQQATSDKGIETSDLSIELATVKRELAELRAKEMLRNEIKESPRSARKSKSEEDYSRSIVSSSVEVSNNSYTLLIRSLGEVLDMKDLPNDNGEVGATAISLVTNRIKLLKDRIGRKEELLSGYENDLTKLRSAEEKLAEKDLQIVELKNEIKERVDESEYLNEALGRTRDSLECEQRLRTATKTRKTHHMMNSSQTSTIMNGHVPHRPTSATRPKSATRPSSAKKAVSDSKESAKRASVDRLKKKDFEIEVLKSELESTTSDLIHAKRQIEIMAVHQESGEVAGALTNKEM